MLARAHRFHGYGSLNSVYRNGRTARSPAFGLRYLVRDSPRPYRVAVVVSRKVSKSAVVRNRIRRRVYAMVRRTDNLITPGSDLIFTVFGDQPAELEADKLQAVITELLEKAAAPRS